ncbi:uncharacterized protein LOC128132329 [Lactuca sativa]|uniref:uncharacterized protein LOC128132329 n=1 Tax=Lactuca sativa TaxID=4236 RepID=UPI0022B0216A|nr:uncharacterized protein LOC128132329 [Lactuca sativa]
MAGFHHPGDPYFPNQGNNEWLDEEPEEDAEDESDGEPEAGVEGEPAEPEEEQEEEEDDNNYGLSRNGFPSLFEDDLPQVDQGEIIFPSSNGGTENHASPTLPPQPPVILPDPRFVKMKSSWLLKPFWCANT